MARNSKVAKLREQLASAQRRVNKKIAYNYRMYGIELKGSRFDPSVDLQKARFWGEKKIRSELKKLNDFQSRRTQFVAGARGEPIPAKTWREYKKTEAAYNRRVERGRTKYDYVKTPSGLPQSEQAKIGRLDYSTKKTWDSVNNDFLKRNFKPANFMSAEKVEKMIDVLKKRATAEDRRERLSKDRETVRKALKIIGDKELLDMVDSLNEKEFEFFYMFSPREVDSLFTWYDSEMMGEPANKSQEAFKDMGDRGRQGFIDFVKWIKESNINAKRKASKRIRRGLRNNYQPV